MRYLNIETGEYPKHLGDLQLIYGNINESQIPKNWVYVEVEPLPEINEYQKFEPDIPRPIDGKWMQGWKIEDMTEDERIAIDAIRAARIEELVKNRPPIPEESSPTEN